MTHDEKAQLIIDYYNEHFKFQKFVYDEFIDEQLVYSLSDKELDKFIKENIK